MKQITCSKCTQVWFVDEPNLQFITTCPYCAASIREKVKFSQPDSLDKAIYLAIEGLGNNALESPTRIGGYISDIAPNLKKELRVLSHTFREEYFSIVRSAFEHDIKTAEKEISKLIRLLIDEDGLSETWAKQIGSSYLDAIKLVNGIGLEEVLLADVTEYKVLPSREESRSNTLPPVQFDGLCTPAHNSPQADIGAMSDGITVRDPEPVLPQFPDCFDVDDTTLLSYTGDSASVIIPEGIKYIAPRAFYCKEITDVQFPSTVRVIGKEAFSYCGNLKKIHFENGLREIQEAAFSHCKLLKEVILPDTVSILGKDVFYWCASLRNVKLSDKLLEIPRNAFYCCDALATIVIPQKVRSLGIDAFSRHTKVIYQN